jgi:OOP family OmpA-OmpF porin
MGPATQIAGQEGIGTESPDAVTGEGTIAAPEKTPDKIPVEAPADLEARLSAGLPVALDDLVFGSGAAALEARDYASLVALAAWLKADPGRKVTLVGHTDASGGLDANIALSRKRAEGVRQVLMTVHDVPPAQVSAEGVGPLAPRAGNDTEEGRRKNRRVEAVPAPT